MKLDKDKYLESRNFKPHKTFLALLLVNLLLGLIVYFFPKEGIPISSYGKLKFVSIDELLQKDTIESPKVELEKVLAGVKPLEQTDDTTALDSSVVSNDSIIAKKTVKVDDIPAYRQIWMPDSNPKALQMLAKALQVESKQKVVRILHYGDSQIEGDRVTNYLRYRLQSTYGGTGAGILLPKEPATDSRRNILIKESENYKKYAIYGNKDKAPKNKYGLGGTTYTITGPYTSFVRWDTTVTTDTLGNSNTKIQAIFSGEEKNINYLDIKMRHMGYSRSRQHTRVRLLYQNTDISQIRLENDGNTLKEILPSTSVLGVSKWRLSTNKKLRISFPQGKTPTIYGVALDGNRGVAVDNFGMRGSSGQGFSAMNLSLYSRLVKQLNVRAVIMQYGVNVVPNALANYNYYKRSMKSQIASFKRANPGISIIVIGPSDMSKNEDGEYASYENIPLIRDAMKKAALESGCCFWDLYEAMGGENAMIEWVDQGLAQKDYTHLTYKGAKYVGEMLFEAIQHRINQYNIVQ